MQVINAIKSLVVGLAIIWGGAVQASLMGDEVTVSMLFEESGI